MKRKKLIISGGYGTGNTGDESILAGLLSKLILDGKYSRDEIVVFSMDPVETASLHKIRARRRNIRDLLTCSEVLIGGGELFQDEGNMALKFSLLCFAAKALRKRVLFYAIGVSKLQNRVAKHVARLSLLLADEVSVRDELSKKQLSRLNVRKNVSIVPDPAMYVEPIHADIAVSLLEKEGIATKNMTLVGLSLRHSKSKSENEIMYQFFSEFVLRVLKKYPSTSIVFMPFTNSKDYPIEKDPILGQRLKEKTGQSRFRVLSHKYTPQEMMGILGLFDLVISGRLHPLIFSLKMNVPCIGVSLDSTHINGICQLNKIQGVHKSSLNHLYSLTDDRLSKKTRVNGKFM